MFKIVFMLISICLMVDDSSTALTLKNAAANKYPATSTASVFSASEGFNEISPNSQISTQTQINEWDKFNKYTDAEESSITGDFAEHFSQKIDGDYTVQFKPSTTSSNDREKTKVLATDDDNNNPSTKSSAFQMDKWVEGTVVADGLTLRKDRENNTPTTFSHHQSVVNDAEMSSEIHKTLSITQAEMEVTTKAYENPKPSTATFSQKNGNNDALTTEKNLEGADFVFQISTVSTDENVENDNNPFIESTISCRVFNICISQGTTHPTTVNGDLHSTSQDPLELAHAQIIEQYTTKDQNYSTALIFQEQSTARTNTDLCSRYGACPSADKEDSWYCHCDDLCHVYNDCCEEYQNTNHRLDNQDIFSCFRIDYGYQNNFGMYVISTFSHEFSNITIINYCKSENVIEHGPPVVDKNNLLRIFANVYCAICNEVQEFSYMSTHYYFLPLRMDVEEILSFQNASSLLSKYSSLRFRILPGNINIRPCIYGLKVSTSPACQRYINPVIIGVSGIIQRNLLCVNDALRRKLTFEDFYCIGEGISGYTSAGRIMHLSIIFNFGQTEDRNVNGELCKAWSEEVSRLCQSQPTYVNVEESITFFLETSSNMTEATDKFLTQIALSALWSFEVPTITRLIGSAVITKSDNGSYIKGDILLKIEKRCFAEELKQIINDFRQYKIEITVKSQMQEKEIRYSSLKSYNASLKTEFTPLKRIRFYMSLDFYLEANSVKINLMTKKQHCQNVTVQSVLIGNELEITDFTCNMSTKTVNSSTLGILTYIGFSVSNVALVPFLVINRRVESVMTVPRTNLENLSVSLILANCMFLVGVRVSHVPTACYVIALVLHYMLLVTFVFITIGIVSVCVAVIKMQERRNLPLDKIKRDRIFVTLLGVLLPLLIVGPAVIMDRLGPPEWSPGYGHSACFPSRFTGNIAFFTGPVMLILAVDLFCLVCIMIRMEVTRKQTRSLNMSRTYDDVKLHLRLVVLSGTLWLTGIIAVIIDSVWMDYFFTVTCGLQGFFIAVGGLSTQEAKKKLKCWNKREQSDIELG